MSPENKAIVERCVSEPMASFLLGGNSIGVGLKGMEALFNTVRAEERARAAEVVKPFAEAFRSLSSRWLDHEDHWADAVTPPNVGDLRRAAAYITDSEGGA
jgi:hypothetical protein